MSQKGRGVDRNALRSSPPPVALRTRRPHVCVLSPVSTLVGLCERPGRGSKGARNVCARPPARIHAKPLPARSLATCSGSRALPALRVRRRAQKEERADTSVRQAARRDLCHFASSLAPLPAPSSTPCPLDVASPRPARRRAPGRPRRPRRPSPHAAARLCESPASPASRRGARPSPLPGRRVWASCVSAALPSGVQLLRSFSLRRPASPAWAAARSRPVPFPWSFPVPSSPLVPRQAFFFLWAALLRAKAMAAPAASAAPMTRMARPAWRLASLSPSRGAASPAAASTASSWAPGRAALT